MLGLGWFKRRRARRQPFPESWREILRLRAPFYAGFDEEARERFEDRLKVFARTKDFVAAGGLSEVTEEMRVVISAGAARLSMGIPGEDYEKLSEIVVYPSHYRHAGEDGIVFGEARAWGSVVLSWEAVQAGIANGEDGHDTAAHEFAHALDIEDGAFDGTPELAAYAAYAPWARVMSAAFLDLKEKGARRRAVLREYGAKNEAEFFAVATEAFFEKPRQMQAKLPALYQVLAEFYGASPAGGEGGLREARQAR